MTFDWEHQKRLEEIRDKIQMNRLIQHARWLIAFGHLRRNWPNSDK